MRAPSPAIAGGRTATGFIATVAAIVPAGEAEVFDVQVPGVNAFDANGLIAHNCGEQPLPPYGACLLGSINLTTLVLDPFEPNARLDLDRLERARSHRRADDGRRHRYLALSAARSRRRRRGPSGASGSASPGSPTPSSCAGRATASSDAVALSETWMRALRRAAYAASIAIAREKGPFPLFDRDQFLAGESIRELEEDLREGIARHGIRNALLTSIAPTGTISLFADNVSSGLEPVFSFKYSRNILMPDGSRSQEEVSDHAFRLFHKLKGEDAPLPDSFVDAQTLAPGDHLVMQAAVQKYIDSSISKTINCPADLPFEAFKDIYLQAYELGCKGCTTYRPNDVTGAVLEVKVPAEKPAQSELPLAQPQSRPHDIYEAGGVVYMTQPLDRPEALPGQTYKLRWPESDHAIYITVNDIVQDGRRRPFEIFINSKNMEHYAWTVGLTRMISAVFRRGGDVSFVVEELKAVFDPRGGYWIGGRYVPSLLAAIGEVIEQHMINIGFIAGPERLAQPQRKVANLPQVQGASEGRHLPVCPKCSQASLIRQEGCDLCTSCGYSKCS